MTAQFPTVNVLVGDESDPHTLAVPCEPINEWLAVTPDVTKDLTFTGYFAVTHIPSGRRTSGAGCVECARAAGRTLAALPVDWSSVSRENRKGWLDAVPTATRQALAKAFNFSCDVENCWRTEAA